jgi:hypothetical protein
MKETRVLPDGGELTYDPMQIEPVGDRGLPRTVLYRHSGGERQPAYEVKLEVWDGVPVCTEVKVIAKSEDWVSIRPKDIDLIATSLEKSMQYWLSEVSFESVDAPAGRRRWRRGLPVPAAVRKDAIAAIEQARRQVRRKPTRSHLAEVADAYNAGEGLSKTERTESVAAALFCSHRTAQRKVREARAKGLIKD